MNSLKYFFLFCFIVCATLHIKAQKQWEGFEHLFTPVKSYVVYQSIGKITIDGKPDEKSWRKAKWSTVFEDIEGDKQPKPLHKTHVKMLWDKNNLYIFAELEEPHIWAYYDRNDMIVFHENDFEVFIDPDRDTHNYYEFEVNARNTLFDLFLSRPYRDGVHADISWNAKGFKSAVQVDGTLNDPTDRDRKWAVEMQIPFASLSANGDFIQPDGGDVWKINFSRVNWQTEIENGRYTPKKDSATKKKLPEYNWVWSPQGVINMHCPERWGMIMFSGNEVNGEMVTFDVPIEEELAGYLWLVYYKQKKYAGKNGRFASSLAELDIIEKGENESANFSLELKSGGKGFEAFLITEKGLTISINHKGLFNVVKN